MNTPPAARRVCVARPCLSRRAARWLRFAWACAALLVLTSFKVRAAETIPPAPANHFNDFAGVVRSETAAALNAELAQFERDTSTQILAVIYPRMQSDSSVEDYAVRVAQKWGVGQKERRNGAVLFVFQQTRDIRIVTGYGLEGALPDALCKQIIENEIIPRFRAGDFDGGLTAGLRAMMGAVRGEYRGAGRTNTERGSGGFPAGAFIPIIIFALILISGLRARSRRSVLYGPRGRRTLWTGHDPWSGWGGGGFGGGGFGGGGWGGGSSGGGTFSGGGGSFGGGGAGGRW